MEWVNVIAKLGSDQKETLALKLLETNRVSEMWGLMLTSEDVDVLIEQREKMLRDYGRIELGTEILEKIIRKFSSSPYIQASEYVQLLVDVQEVFHYIKNEMEDSIGDDELIELLADLYDDECHGDMELLAGRQADRIITLFKNGRWEVEKDDWRTKERQIDHGEACEWEI